MTRADWGLPSSWKLIEDWCRKPFTHGRPLDSHVKKSSKYDHMDFTKPGTKEFWASFPSRAIPEKVSTRIDVDWLEAEIESLEDSMTVHERDMATRAIRQLREGAPAYQIADLPGEIMKNSASITKCGAAFTETLEQWIIDGYVAGPFMEPPLADFRANSLMAVEQKDKIRPVVNMSHPKGRSFNDNVDKLAVGKATMSSAKQFGQTVRAAGRGAIMSKMDMKDAYKLVPAQCRDYRLQGSTGMGHTSLRPSRCSGQTRLWTTSI